MTIAEKLQTIAENEQKVYNSGYNEGHYAGWHEGIAAVADYNEFWDAAQYNGTRTAYAYGFAGSSWNETTFRPKYDIICREGDTAYGMFYGNQFSGDLAARLDECEVSLDTSKATELGLFMCFAAKITRVGIIDSSGATTLYRAFKGCSSLTTIDNLILKSDGSQDLDQAFDGCTALTNITITGAIGALMAEATINFGDCTKLSGASLLSIVGALHIGGAARGGTIIFSQMAIDNAIASDLGQFLSSWENLLANRTNWTFVYV